MILWRAQLGNNRVILPIPIGQSDDGKVIEIEEAVSYGCSRMKRFRPPRESFKMKRDALIVECSPSEARSDGIPIYDEESDDPSERERAVWCDISQAFSSPVTQNDATPMEQD
jgi:hypothetical protein